MSGGVFTEFDRQAMARALELAARGTDTTHPNPRVGCVIARGETIIGEGWHERAGGPHAEIAALRNAAPAGVEGATAYVTLEPCSHHGRTPPCVDALIEARVGRVVFAMRDPNPRVSGRGAEALARAGIEAQAGLLAEAAEELNAGYLKRMRTGRPWVRVKLAMSLDGRTALANGASRWITSDEAREDVQRWRARSSVVLTGIGTVLADDPRLDVRIPGAARQPLRVVLDSRLRTPPDARLFESAGGVLIVAAGGGQPRAPGSEPAGQAPRSFSDPEREARASALRTRGARVEQVSGEERPDLAALLALLGDLEMNEVLVEAGAVLAGAFVRESLADELLVYIAPKVLGPQGRPLLELPEIGQLQSAPQFAVVEQSRTGADLRIRLRPLCGREGRSLSAGVMAGVSEGL